MQNAHSHTHNSLYSELWLSCTASDHFTRSDLAQVLTMEDTQSENNHFAKWTTDHCDEFYEALPLVYILRVTNAQVKATLRVVFHSE